MQAWAFLFWIDKMKSMEDYKRDCTCGEYKPYAPKGIVAAMYQIGECLNCVAIKRGYKDDEDQRQDLRALQLAAMKARKLRKKSSK